MKENVRAFIENEKGEFGVRQIAITIGVILVVGIAIGIFQTNLGTWLGDVWEILMGALEELAGTP